MEQPRIRTLPSQLFSSVLARIKHQRIKQQTAIPQVFTVGTAEHTAEHGTKIEPRSMQDPSKTHLTRSIVLHPAFHHSNMV